MTITSIDALSYLASTTVATYADLNGATTASNLILALSKSDSKAGFTQEQANEFAKKYTFLDQLPNVPYNGFSAARRSRGQF